MRVLPRCLPLLLLAAPALAEDAIPQPWPAARYAEFARQSPFALATAAVSSAASPIPSFASDWFVSGVARIGRADFVTIKSRDASMQFSIFGREPHPQHGICLAEVRWSEAVGKSVVILRKGQELAALEFNEVEVRGPEPASPRGALPVALSPSARAATAALPKSNGLIVLQRKSEEMRTRR